MTAATASRVYILGAAGSGKTTLAAAIGRASDVRPVELDADPHVDRAALATEDTWVVEGIFLYDIEPLLQRATTIVWLDLPRRVAQRRIVTRHVKLSLLRRNRYKGIGQLVRFVRSMAGYYAKPAREPVQLRTPREARVFRRKFRAH